MLALLRDQPALALFLVIGVGYVLGRLRMGGVQLGGSTGVLLGGLVLGHFGVRGTSASQSIGFMLFMYCVGLRAGPQFFRAFRENGARFFALAFAVAAVGITAAVVLDAELGLPPGYRAGLLAGALTSTPTLVAAQDAVRDGLARLPEGWTPQAVLDNLAAAYAITYVFGMFGLLVLVSVLPRIMGVDLAAEARRLSGRRQGADAPHAQIAYGELPVLRAYRVTRDTLVGVPLGRLERTGWLVERLKRDGVVTDATPDTRLEPGDLVAVLGRRPDQLDAQEKLGVECVDTELLAVGAQTRTILVTGRAARPVETPGAAAELGCFIVEVTRAGLPLPPAPELRLAKGDLVVVAGVPRDLDALAERLGRSERPGDETDLVTFAFGVAAGIAIGLVSVRIHGIPIGLRTAGGLLLSGLVIGFLRTLNPTFGQVPVAATAVLMELGLQFFMANVGLGAGGSVLATLASAGPGLAVGGVVVMALPVVVGVVVGRMILGFDAVILLGALTGAMTSTPALDLVNRQAKSALPTVGYAGTYAFANVLLAIAGAMLVRL